MLFDPAGNVVERCEYDAYGKAKILTPAYSPLPDSQFANSYLFTGRRLDTMDVGSLTIHHYRARAYDPDTGRFMQRDPLGIAPAGGASNPFRASSQYKDGLNTYEYVKSNVVLNSDALGLAPTLPWPVKNNDKACCKITKSSFARTTCSQVTINSKGAGAAYACKCHFKGQKNVKIYDTAPDECCWCTLYYVHFPGLLSGVLGDDSTALGHKGLGVVCKGEKGWMVDFGAKSFGWDDGARIQSFDPDNFSTISIMGRVSCAVAKKWKGKLEGTGGSYLFPLNDCEDFAKRTAKFMKWDCP